MDEEQCISLRNFNTEHTFPNQVLNNVITAILPELESPAMSYVPTMPQTKMIRALKIQLIIDDR